MDNNTTESISSIAVMVALVVITMMICLLIIYGITVMDSPTIETTERY